MLNSWIKKIKIMKGNGSLMAEKTKIKTSIGGSALIEGIMMNRPVVSTPVGARGFDCVFQANRHYWLANSDQEFVDQVLNVLSDRTKASLMAREACEIAKVKFSQESFFEVVKTSLSRLFQNTFFPNFDVIPKVVSPFRGNNNKTRNSWTCGEKA